LDVLTVNWREELPYNQRSNLNKTLSAKRFLPKISLPDKNSFQTYLFRKPKPTRSLIPPKTFPNKTTTKIPENRFFRIYTESFQNSFALFFKIKLGKEIILIIQKKYMIHSSYMQMHKIPILCIDYENYGSHQK
jgi:hypothetical protein